jgi:predicted ATPase/DNA-binding winged helix-turn-helix (wHTH) protein
MNSSDSERASFGPFQLFPTARVIVKDGVPLGLGNRALDILIVLIERSGEVVSHKELMSRAWRGLVVDPGNLRVHVNNLRKALGDDGKGNRYIANVPGQGYCFVAPIRRGTPVASPAATVPVPGPVPVPAKVLAPVRVEMQVPCGPSDRCPSLPQVLARMVGRDETVRTIASDLIVDRFITIIGPGGMGKTTVAVSVAHALVREFAGAVCFVDLGSVSDPKLVTTAVASSLGVAIRTDTGAQALLDYLRAQRILLVLDNCEQVIDAIATLADVTSREAPGVHLLATSREALRVEGEHAYWLPPLESPAPGSRLNAADVAGFPAVKLFMERATASGARFELTDENAPTVAGICGRLDGIALAIEIAAGRVGSHGITGTAELLNRNLGLDWRGRRTALPRHQTLRALLDWSYGLLAAHEQLMLQRLSIFVGTFSVEAAQAIACGGALDEVRAVNTLDSLVAKSLVSVVTVSGSAARYRLLETTRVYASEKLRESGEAPDVAERHGKYFRRLLRTAFGKHFGHGNARAALAWCDAAATASA